MWEVRAEGRNWRRGGPQNGKGLDLPLLRIELQEVLMRW